MNRKITTKELVNFIENELGVSRKQIRLIHFTYDYNILGFLELTAVNLMKLFSFINCESAKISAGDCGTGYFSVFWKNSELSLIKDHSKLLICQCGFSAGDHGVKYAEEIAEIYYGDRIASCTKSKCKAYYPRYENL